MKSAHAGLAVMLGLSTFCFAGASAGQGEVLRFVPNAALLQSIEIGKTRKDNAAAPPLEVVKPKQKPAAVVSPVAKPGTSKSNAAMTKSWPVTLEETRAIEKARITGQRDGWSPDEVSQARARCNAILKRIDVVATFEEPLREGECGTPAPIRLISIGKKPEVVISPPALVNCDMAEALHTWLKQDLQPLARKHLGGPLVKIAKMSDYSCRNAYGRARGRLSEHGTANALDIAGFTTAQGEQTMLLADWGMTSRDIRRQVAAAKNKARAEDTRRIAAEQRGRDVARATIRGATPGAESDVRPDAAGALPPTALGVNSGAPAGGVARSSIIEGIPRVTVTIPGASSDDASEALGGSLMSRLGGPKPHDLVTGSVVVKTGGVVDELRKQRFLRGAHESACRIFGTVLGPEANNAHRNHFHVDLAARRSGNFCQ